MLKSKAVRGWALRNGSEALKMPQMRSSAQRSGGRRQKVWSSGNRRCGYWHREGNAGVSCAPCTSNKNAVAPAGETAFFLLFAVPIRQSRISKLAGITCGSGLLRPDRQRRWLAGCLRQRAGILRSGCRRCGVRGRPCRLPVCSCIRSRL